MKTLIAGSFGMAQVIIIVPLPGAIVSIAFWGSIPIGGLSSMMRRCHND